MPWSGWVVIAAMSLLCLLVGCGPTQQFLADWTQSGQGELIAASPDELSVHLENGLKSLGLDVRASKDGDVVRLDSTTRSGKQFHLLLTRQGEQTRLRIVWEKDADGAFWLDLLEMARPTRPAPQASTPTPTPERVDGATR